MFLFWLRLLPQCGDQTPASFPSLAEGRSIHTNTPVFPPSSFILPIFMWVYILFSAGSGTPVCAQLVFCLPFCVWRCIPDVSVEREVLHIHLLLCHLVFPPLFLQFSSDTQLCPDSVTPWTAAHQASLSNSQSLFKFMFIELVMPSNNLILCRPLLLLSSIFPSIKVFSNESALCGGQNIGVSASTSVLPKNTQDWSPLGWTGWISLQSKGLSRVFNTTLQKHQFFGTQHSL